MLHRSYLSIGLLILSSLLLLGHTPPAKEISATRLENGRLLPATLDAEDELLEQRTATSATYQQSDDRYTTILSSKALHYQDVRGEWRPIDPTFTTSPDGFTVEHNSIQSQTGLRRPWVAATVGETAVVWEATALGTTTNGRFTAYAQPRPDGILPEEQADGRRLRYSGGWDDAALDELIISAPDSIEQALLLHEPPAASGSPEFLEMQATLELLPGTTLWANGAEQTAAFTTAGMLEIRNAAGETSFVFEPVVAYEENDHHAAVAGEYLLEPAAEEGRWLVSVRTPFDWWVETERQYPVVLDPTMKVLRPYSPLGHNSMAWISNTNNQYIAGEMRVGAHLPNYNSKARAYMQFNDLPNYFNYALAQEIDKATLLITPSANQHQKYWAKGKNPPDWDSQKISHQVSLYYIGDCPTGSNCQGFTLYDDTIFQDPATYNWNSSPKSTAKIEGSKPLSIHNKNHGKSPPKLVSTAWDITGPIRDWYTQWNDFPSTRYGPTFMLTSAETCDTDAPYYGHDTWKVPACSNFTIRPEDVTLIIEYTSPPLPLGTNHLHDGGVPSYLTLAGTEESILEETAHQYELDNTGNKWRGISVRGNHGITDTIPTKVGLNLYTDGTDSPLVTMSNQTAEQTGFVLMNGANGGSGINSATLTAAVTGFIENDFINDYNRNYRLHYVEASDLTVPTGSWYNFTLYIKSDELINLQQFNLDIGDNLLIIAEGSDSLSFALVEPRDGTTLIDGVVGSKEGSDKVGLMGTNADNEPIRGTYIGYIPRTGKAALVVTNTERPNYIPDVEGDPGDLIAEELALKFKVLRCRAGEIATAKYGCQPLWTPDSGQLVSESLPGLGVTVYARAFDYGRLPSLGNWCTTQEADGAPVIAKGSVSPKRWVAVGQGTLCYDSATDTLTSSNDSAVGVMAELLDTSAPGYVPGRGFVAPDFMYGSTAISPVPEGVLDGIVQISQEGGGDTIQRFDNTRVNINPFDRYWATYDNYTHSTDSISLTEMQAVGSGVVATQLTVEADAAPPFMVWDVSWNMYTNPYNPENFYDFGTTVIQTTSLSQPLDLASTDLRIFGDGYEGDDNGIFKDTAAYKTIGGPDVYLFHNETNTLTNDLELGGATKFVQTIIQPPGESRMPENTTNCQHNSSPTSCLDLREEYYRWDNGQGEKALQPWELPDIHISDSVGTLMFATDGRMDIYSADHPYGRLAPEQLSETFSFDTWEVTANVSQKQCEPNGPVKTVIEGTGYIALPMIGSNGSGGGPFVEVDFQLCETALRQATLSLNIKPAHIPIGSSGLGVQFVSGTITVGPDSTRASFTVDVISTDPKVPRTLVGTGTITIDTAGLLTLQGDGKIVGKLDANFRLDVAWNPLDILMEGEVSYAGGLVSGYMRLHGWVGQGWQGKYAYINDQDFHFTGTIKGTVRIQEGQLIDAEVFKVPPFNASISAEIAFGEFCSNKQSCEPIKWGMSATINVFGHKAGVYVDDSGPDIFLGSSSKVLLDQCTTCTAFMDAPADPQQAWVTQQQPDNVIATPGLQQAYVWPMFTSPFADVQPVSGNSTLCSGFGTPTHRCKFTVEQGTGRAMFSAGWVNGNLEMSLLAPGNTLITEGNPAGYNLAVTEMHTSTVKQTIFAISPMVTGATLPSGEWQIQLEGVSTDPDLVNHYQLAFAADPPAPQFTWQSVLNPQTSPVGSTVALNWQTTRGGIPINQTTDPNVVLDLFYAPVYQPPVWQARTISFPGNYATAAGLGGNWDPAAGGVSAGDGNQDNVWTLTTNNIPAGDWAFKAAVNNSWDENYGLDGVYFGENISFTVSAANQPLTFYYDPRDNYTTTNAREEIVVLVGDMMDEIGGADWTPDNLVGWMKPRAQDESYEIILHVPAGDWKYKVAVNESWAENYGAGGLADGDDIALTVPEEASFVRFLYDPQTHLISHEILAQTPGTMIVGRLPAGTTSYPWDTSSLAAGEYRVGVRLADHFQGNGQVVAWAPGTVLIEDNEAPPVPTVLDIVQIPDALSVHWARNDVTPDLAGYLIEYEIPGFRVTDPYIPVTRRVVPQPQSVAPFWHHIRLGGLLMSRPDLPDLVRTTVCVRAYDASGNVSGCNATEVTMEEAADDPYLGPPQYLGASYTSGLDVNWEPPLSGTPAGYLLFYEPIGCANNETFPDALQGPSPIDVGDTVSYVLDELAFNQTYLITVQGYTANGMLGEKATTIGRNLSLIDADANGLPDVWAEVLGIDDPNEDLDGDGLIVSAEAALGSDPFKADSDGDGFYDGEEAVWETDICGAEQPPYHIQPKLALSGPGGMVFETAVNLPSSDPQTIDIYNRGGGETLIWSAAASDSWIELSHTAGEGLTELAIAADATGLPAGQYQGTVTIQSSHAAASLPQGGLIPAITEQFTIPVYLTVLPKINEGNVVYLPLVVK